jgi:hypothetical protein
MSIFIIMFLLNVVGMFCTAASDHMLLCTVCVVMAILNALLAMMYEGRLLIRIKNLEQEIKDLKRRLYHG